MCACVYVHVCMCSCVYVCEGGGRVMLVRHLCVLRVGFWCLELCVFLFNCLLYAPWAHLRRGAQKPHYYCCCCCCCYYHYFVDIIIIIISIHHASDVGFTSSMTYDIE